jgi:hypothetical protein
MEKPCPHLVGTLVDFISKRPLPAQSPRPTESTLSLGHPLPAHSFGLLGLTRPLALGVRLSNFCRLVVDAEGKQLHALLL